MSKPGRALATAWLLAGALSGAWGQAERPVSVVAGVEPWRPLGTEPVSAEDGALPEGPLPSLNDNRPAPPPEPLFTLIETGLASWYHPSFAGRRMANGQPYRPGDFTAAHKTLPLDSHARVVNLSTGVDVVVRITDRGPHVAGRVVDLSQAAARELGLLGLGVTLVEVHSATPEDWAEFVARQPGVNSALHDRPLRVPTHPKRR